MSLRVSNANRMSFIAVKPIEPTEVQYRSRDHLKIVRNYAIGRRLGEGSYGKVKEGINIVTKQRVAIKIYAKKEIKKIEGGEASAQKEIDIMKSLQHENIVQAIEDFEVSEKEKLYVVLEFCNGGTLQDLLDKSPNNILPLRQTRRIFRSIVNGLVYLQSQGIIHRDIKPDNILFNSNGDVKIGDFGVAVKIDLSEEKALENFKWKQGDQGGSLAFQPPECQEIDYSSIPDLDEIGPLITKRDGKVAPMKLDVWSAGVVLYIMVVGKFPFESPNIISLFTNIARGKFQVPDWVEMDVANLIKGILQVDPDNRLTLQQIKKTPWMKVNLPKDDVQMVQIEPISSLFGNDEKTLNKILEDLQNRSDRKSKDRLSESESGGDGAGDETGSFSSHSSSHSDSPSHAKKKKKNTSSKKNSNNTTATTTPSNSSPMFLKDKKSSKSAKFSTSKPDGLKMDNDTIKKKLKKRSSSSARFSKRLSGVFSQGLTFNNNNNNNNSNNNNNTNNNNHNHNNANNNSNHTSVVNNHLNNSSSNFNISNTLLMINGGNHNIEKSEVPEKRKTIPTEERKTSSEDADEGSGEKHGKNTDKKCVIL